MRPEERAEQVAGELLVADGIVSENLRSRVSKAIEAAIRELDNSAVETKLTECLQRAAELEERLIRAIDQRSVIASERLDLIEKNVRLEESLDKEFGRGARAMRDRVLNLLERDAVLLNLDLDQAIERIRVIVVPNDG